MKYSVEKEIMRYPTGVETGRAALEVDGIGFLNYSIGGNRYVWRTPDNNVEVGQRGAGGTFYCKVRGQIIEHTFASLHSAAQYGATMMDAYAAPVIFGR